MGGSGGWSRLQVRMPSAPISPPVCVRPARFLSTLSRLPAARSRPLACGVSPALSPRSPPPHPLLTARGADRPILACSLQTARSFPPAQGTWVTTPNSSCNFLALDFQSVPTPCSAPVLWLALLSLLHPSLLLLSPFCPSTECPCSSESTLPAHVLGGAHPLHRERMALGSVSSPDLCGLHPSLVS